MTSDSLVSTDSPFDELAPDYDASFTSTALGARLREAVWERFDARFAHSGRLLDIGCGTGEDAIRLARRGHAVVATDVSAPMLELAAGKARRAGCSQRIEFRRVAMERLGEALAGEHFDGVYSNFGALNCTSRLETLAAELAPMLGPGAPLVWVLMGRHVPWEWAWFLARGDGRRAFRRIGRGGARFRGKRIHYPTPARAARALEPRFEPLKLSALGCVLPPTYASDWLVRSPRLFAVLSRLERAASRWQPLAALADHYIIEARRAAEPDDA